MQSQLFRTLEDAENFAACFEDSYAHVKVVEQYIGTRVNYCCPLNPKVSELPRFQEDTCQLTLDKRR